MSVEPPLSPEKSPLPAGEAALFVHPTRLAAGWYALAASRDLLPGRVLAASVGRRHFALFRDADGQARVLRDSCPHLAARLSAGQLITTRGEVRLRCPFHGWEITPDGRVALAPGHGGVERAGVSYPCTEGFGLVWVHLAATGEQPTPLPDFTEPGSDAPTWKVLKEKRMNCHPHWVLANGLDGPHFSPVHGMVHVEPPRLDGDRHGRPRLELRGHPRQPWLRGLIGAGPSPVHATFTAWGPGCCGLEFLAPIPFRVVFSARPDAGGRALTRVALSLPDGVRRYQALLLLLVLLWKDRQILEGSRLQPTFCGAEDAGLAAFARLVQAAGEARD